jgi:dTDP-4-dehydrorhamnose 3,5-epimerase
MKVIPYEIPGLKIVQLKRFDDDRGFFVERFNSSHFEPLGLPVHFVQDNLSRSAPGVLRGLHFQYDEPQGKLVGVVRGKIWDVAVDIRANSPTFGKWAGIELNGEDQTLFWIPPGFAHGFCNIGNESADVYYKTTAVYKATGEEGLLWSDPEFDIHWPIAKPIVSPRDEALPRFLAYRLCPRF